MRFRDLSEQGIFKMSQLESKYKRRRVKSFLCFSFLLHPNLPYPWALKIRLLMQKNFCIASQRFHKVARVRIGLIDQWTCVPLNANLWLGLKHGFHSSAMGNMLCTCVHELNKKKVSHKFCGIVMLMFAGCVVQICLIWYCPNFPSSFPSSSPCASFLVSTLIKSSCGSGMVWTQELLLHISWNNFN